MTALVRRRELRLAAVNRRAALDRLRDLGADVAPLLDVVLADGDLAYLDDEDLAVLVGLGLDPGADILAAIAAARRQKRGEVSA